MRRRELLASGGVALASALGAGCVAAPSTSAEPPAEPDDATETRTETPPDGFRRRVEIRNVASVPESPAVSLSVELANPWVTAERTASFDVTLRNDAGTPREFGPPFVWKESGRSAVNPYPTMLGDHGMVDPGIVVKRAGTDGDASPPTCIGTDGKSTDELGSNQSGAPTHELGSGESLTWTYGVYDDPRFEGCVPPGDYRYEWTYRPRAPGETPSDDSGFEWGFDLRIERPP